MMADDLRAATRAIRAALSPAGTAPIEEHGLRLVTVPRTRGAELRISFDDRNSSGSVLSIRLWCQSSKGYLYPSKQGVFLRVAELPALVEAIALAAQLTAAHRAPASDSEATTPDNGQSALADRGPTSPADAHHEARPRRPKKRRRQTRRRPTTATRSARLP